MSVSLPLHHQTVPNTDSVSLNAAPRAAVLLSRAVRFAVNRQSPEAQGLNPPDRNGYGGVPAVVGFGQYLELIVTCRGKADPVTGYFIDIKTIDQGTRAHVVPAISAACRGEVQTTPEAVLAATAPALSASLGGTLASLRLNLSPFSSIEHSMAMTSPDAAPARAILRQRFEIAAAHRLHAAGLSDEENRATFGKCNHPAGHGHNYVFEPAVALADTSGRFTLAMLEAMVYEHLTLPFDHTHLNLDRQEFDQSRGGLNPSVENIAQVFFSILQPVVACCPSGAKLLQMTVWETEKTSAQYPG